MHSVDFLPSQYQRSHARRRTKPWRVVVVSAFAALVAAAAVGQHQRRSAVERDLAALASQYAEAETITARWQAIQAELETARAEAELYTYLRHPWPRSQVIREVLAPRPEGIVFERLEISHRVAAGGVVATSQTTDEAKAEAARLAQLPPAARDLVKLRRDYDQRSALVTITGTTVDSSLLHTYLAELRKLDLISRVDLPQIDAHDEKDGPQLEFKVTLVIRPGYGQPGGPAGPLAAASDLEDVEEGSLGAATTLAVAGESR
jgi:hypothetical protein